MFSGKKALCVATAALMAVPVIMTGCNKPADSKTKDTSACTLNIWLAGDPQQGISRIDSAINDHLKSLKGTGSNISVNIQMMGWGDDFQKKATTMFSTGGSDADILFTCNWVDKYRQNASNNYLEPLTNDLKTEEGKEIVKILGQDFLNGSKIKGVNYALPTNKEKAHDWGFLVRSDLFKKYNMDATKIKSLKDMEPYFAQAKADGITALDIAAFDGPWHFLDWDMVSDDGIPAAIDDSTNKVIDPFTDSRSVDMYKTLKGYADKGYISKDATTSKGIDADLKTGKFFCGVNSLKPGKDKEESVTTAPYNYTQIDITPVVKSNRETTGAMLGINKFSKHKDAAFDFLYLLYTDKDLINLVAFGQDTKDYTTGSDGRITAQKTDYSFGAGWMFGDQFKDKLASTEDTTKWSNFETFNKSAKVLPSLGFMYDDAKMQTQVAALGNVVNDYYKQLLAGQVADVDKTVAEMKGKLDTAGEAAFLADIQTQYDKFPKAK